ncbi:glycosyltransferase involved in cell wall biosynthesis [Chitinophaga skermanii]|uniref:Glycosyltransferase involved in cell wall biosynthesis n=1 Tax=Chitinophaga skermanii TaxID=331697 RepID=A0A327QXG0_9BACT|nr:glycosyltransferase [Chitinophaga skermanii]RAJ08322.1 glycosyltransferase involved in cell wall biosynthesis [Chitinophaga skermanii]
MKKISICTVCMNRLEHLKETLLTNIRHNEHVEGIEFVVLDYNSADGMEDWAKEHLQPYIDTGLVNYYKTFEPEHFHISHSKNMALRLGQGEIICMVDADNYTGEGYAAWVQDAFNPYLDKTIVTTLRRNYIPYRDQGGRLAFHQNMYYQARGFNEKMAAYGIEDVDLVNRMEDMGGQRVYIEDEKFLGYIGHSNVDRIKNYKIVANIRDILLAVTGDMERRNHAIYLMKDGTCYDVVFHYDQRWGINPVLSYLGWQILPGDLLSGTYEENGAVTRIDTGNDTGRVLKVSGELFVEELPTGDQKWQPVSKKGPAFLNMLLSFSECHNRYQRQQVKQGGVNVNEEGWGRGIVYKNFGMESPIRLT